jgi:hypothetical protein
MELLTHTVRRVATVDDLSLPGDYCTVDHFETDGKICHSYLMNCPFCRMTNAVVLPKPDLYTRIKEFFRVKRGLTLDTVIACYAKPDKHRFSVRDSYIIKAI